MQAMTATKIKDLKEGDVIDLEPVLAWLDTEGFAVTFEEAITAAWSYATVDSVALEQSLARPGETVAVIYSTDGGNWAVPAELHVPRVVGD